MSSPEKSPDLLIAKYLEGTSSPEEADSLLTLLRTNEEVKTLFQRNLWCDFYLRERALSPSGSECGPIRNQVNSQLSWDELVVLQNAERPISVIVEEYKASQAAQRAGSSLPKAVLRIAKKCLWFRKEDLNNSVAPVFTAISLLVLLVVVSTVAIVRFYGTPPANPITTMARVNETIDAVWSEGGETFSRGQLVDESHFQLKSGLVQLEMNNGTVLILEGPADVAVVSPNKVFGSSGKMSVKVSKSAIGYEIVTPQGNVIDRGTEFFIDLTKEDIQLEVIKGQVDYLSQSKDVFSLFADQALKFNQTGRQERYDCSGRTSAFISTSLFEEKADRKTRVLRQEQKEADEKIADTPGLLARFDVTEIQNSGQREFENLAPDREKGYSELILKKCNLGPGEWKNSSAILFNQKQGYGEVHLPGKYPALRITARIQISRLENEGNVLVASDSFMREKGAFLVQILKTGEVQLQISTGDQKAEYYVSPPVVTKRRMGTWMDLSVVFDEDMQQIRMYLDGKCILTERWRQMMPVVCGDLTVGNFVNFRGLASSRHLGGSLSQLMIFDSVRKQ